jgi:hypothetical protein
VVGCCERGDEREILSYHSGDHTVYFLEYRTIILVDIHNFGIIFFQIETAGSSETEVMEIRAQWDEGYTLLSDKYRFLCFMEVVMKAVFIN